MHCVFSLPGRAGQWHYERRVSIHSSGTVQDLHLFPFSSRALSAGNLAFLFVTQGRVFVKGTFLRWRALPRLILYFFPRPNQSGLREGGGLEEGKLKGLSSFWFPSSGVFALFGYLILKRNLHAGEHFREPGGFFWFYVGEDFPGLAPAHAGQDLHGGAFIQSFQHLGGLLGFHVGVHVHQVAHFVVFKGLGFFEHGLNAGFHGLHVQKLFVEALLQAVEFGFAAVQIGLTAVQ